MKFIMYFGFLPIIFAFNLHKEKESKTTSSIEKLFVKISKFEDKHQRKLAFQSLSPDERFQLWEYKFQRER
jgi:hypothetical protein